MESYPFNEIEKKWRERWEESQVNKIDLQSTNKKKLYALVMFSYPSEKKLHIGHWWNYGGVDTYARFKRMQGYNVFEPMGFDAFGLPAENFAVKHGVHPASTTRNSINLIREQLKQIGAMYDWSKEVDTSKPEYYKWTQWLFLQLYNSGAAYKKRSKVNWCPKCQTVLANEQVDDGSCERCSTVVTTRDLKQWFFRITDFADDLIDGLDDLDWPEATKTRQKHWIGRSHGTEIEFPVVGHSEKIIAFTTRADTLFGVTYMVLAPEHPLIESITTSDNSEAVTNYLESVKDATDIERLSTAREKSGVFTGAYAINPANNDKIPVWTADYVLGTYGTGAVMAVPAHDQRDFEFATKYHLPIKWVIKSEDDTGDAPTDAAFEEYGMMWNSSQFDGLSTKDGIEQVTEWLASKEAGRLTTNYRLRDWLISRQRYWGAPIPIIYCDTCGTVPVPEDQLPVLLPEDIVDFAPQGNSPLGACEEFMSTPCPKCGGEGRRDPDTMDTFVDSSWYFLRYLSTDCTDKPFDKDRVNQWLPADVYVGGPEHATGHLIYARYITKFLNSQGYIDFDEPAKRMIHQGIITYKGQRMSKSKGNVVNPDSFIEKYGSDCFRMYLMFMGDYTLGGDWSDDGIKGVKRFLNRVWGLVDEWKRGLKDKASKQKNLHEIALKRSDEVKFVMHSTIKSVTADFDRFHFNTAIARLMEFVNELYSFTRTHEMSYEDTNESLRDYQMLGKALDILVRLLGPLAPHVSEELWRRLGHSESLFEKNWPDWDENALEQDMINIGLLENGKRYESLAVQKDSAEEDAITVAKKSDRFDKRMVGKKIIKTVYVPNQILNFVTKSIDD